METILYTFNKPPLEQQLGPQPNSSTYNAYPLNQNFLNESHSYRRGLWPIQGGIFKHTHMSVREVPHKFVLFWLELNGSAACNA